ncbi:MAG: hypothetical protein R2788_21225 [Saprospiraceae bacterium]
MNNDNLQIRPDYRLPAGACRLWTAGWKSSPSVANSNPNIPPRKRCCRFSQSCHCGNAYRMHLPAHIAVFRGKSPREKIGSTKHTDTLKMDNPPPLPSGGQNG